MRGLGLRGVASLVALALLACTPEKVGETDAGDATADGARGTDAAQDSGADAGLADDAMPEATSADLTNRARHLLEAIAKSSPDLALDMLFPREGYIGARDAQDPGKLWDVKLKPAYEAQVKRAAKRTKGLDRAVFVSFELGKSISRIVPKKKEWKTPLWRVKRSSITFTIDGKAHRMEIAELVAWRGNWYLAKLH
jgi:hypothetical protein